MTVWWKTLLFTWREGMTKGIPFIIAAPSGAGKTSLVAGLVKANPAIVVSISYTTRPLRPGEQDGVNYHFVTAQQFDQLIAENALLEYAKVFDYYYGTSRRWVEERLNAGYDVILEIDWQGARQIRRQLPSAVSIFIFPPSLDDLHKRLLKRGQDDKLVIERRMQLAQAEMSHYQEFDYLIINEDFDVALVDLTAIIRSQHLRREQQLTGIPHLITNLL